MEKPPVWADHFLRAYIENQIEEQQQENGPSEGDYWHTCKNPVSDLQSWLAKKQNGLIQITGPKGSGKSWFLTHLFRASLQILDLSFVPVYLPQTEQQTTFVEQLLGHLNRQDYYANLDSHTLTHVIRNSSPLLIFCEGGTLTLPEKERLIAQGHALVITGEETITDAEIWEMQKINPDEATQFLSFDSETGWNESLKRFQKEPLGAIEIANLLSNRELSAPTFPAEWQAAKEGKLGAYREYLKALKAYLQKYTPDFHANSFDEGFVPVNVRTQVEVLREDETEENPEATDEKEMTWQTAVPDELIEKLRAEGAGRLVITGGAGSGKSTLLRHLCLEMAQNHAHVWPLYLRLYDIQASGIGKQDLQRLLADHAELTQLQRVYQAYRGEESEVLTFLFLDGWDEVSQARDDVALWLKNRLNRYPVVLASREQSLETQSNSEELYWTLDFDANAQEHLIERFPGLKPEEKEAMLKKISHASGIFGNPLFVCLFAQTYQGNESLELTTKTKLMDYFCKALISEWNKHRNLAYTEIFGELLSLTERTKSNIQVKKIQDELFELLAYLAFRIHCSGVELTPTYLVQWLETFPHSSANILVEKLREEKEYLKDWLKQISSVSGLLQEIPIHPDSYRFLHQSFQEYLCARFIHHHFSPKQRDWFIRDKTVKKGPEGWEYLPAQPEDWPWSCLVNTEGHYPLMELHDPLWREVLIYLMALDNPASASDLNQGLCWRIFQGSFSDEDSEANQILAAWGAVERRDDQILRESVLSTAREGIHSKDFRERRACVTVLGILSDVEYLPQIIELLLVDIRSLNQAALETIRRIGKPAAVYLTNSLQDKESEIKKTSAKVLGWLKAETAIEPLITALQDEDSEVRAAAAEALGELKAEEAIQPLITLLGDENWIVGKTAIRALGKLNINLAIEPFINALKFGNSKVRASSARALRWLKAQLAIEHLITSLSDKDWQVRKSSVQTLGWLKAEIAIEPLIFALKDNNPKVKKAVINALWKLKAEVATEPLIKALLDENSEVRASAARALGELKAEEAIQPLITLLEDEDSEVRAAAAKALGSSEAEVAIKPLIKALLDEDAEVRTEAAIGLRWLKAEEAIVPLIAALKDEDSEVRAAAAIGLGGLKAEEAIQPLITLLEDEDSEVRAAAAKALGSSEAEVAIKPLIKALLDEDAEVRAAAAEGLGWLEAKEATAPLIAALKDEDSQVITSSALALGKIKAVLAIEPLIAALQDETPWVRDAAAEALGELRSEVAIAPLIAALDDEDWQVKIHSAKSLGKLKVDQGIEFLIAALNDEDSWVRRYSTKALGKLKAESAIPALIEALGDQNPEVRSAAAEALGELKSEVAIGPLIAALNDKDSDVRATSAYAIGKLNAKTAIDSLIIALEDKKLRVRNAAREVLNNLISK